MVKSKTVEETCIVLSSGETTIPALVRHALGLESGGKITFRVEGYGRISVKQATAHGDDPLAREFLRLIERDIADGAHLRDLPAGVTKAMRNLLARSGKRS